MAAASGAGEWAAGRARAQALERTPLRCGAQGSVRPSGVDVGWDILPSHPSVFGKLARCGVRRPREQPVITGFNTDIKHSGKVYHIQTEDKGLQNPYVESLVYVGGEI